MVRFKNRYITIEISSPEIPERQPLYLKPSAIYEAILAKIQQLHGDFGVAAVRTGFLTKYCNENTRIAIIRCRHGPHQFVTSSLPFITKLGQYEVTLQTHHVGATLKHSFIFIQRYHRKFLDSMWSNLHSDEDKKALEIAVTEFTRADVSMIKDNLM
ncbi:ribonuclease P/MRP protein subunit POP5 [Pieris napi]|uniref:ribonuclease P/MRP protein subunit POP5 n=1 Tax=Pieris napi TaxID=78633 RepID=UPI001FBBCFDC|nr:ribonuclease P/MRP protein subunit POP5 [Pieris napi]